MGWLFSGANRDWLPRYSLQHYLSEPFEDRKSELATATWVSSRLELTSDNAPLHAILECLEKIEQSITFPPPKFTSVDVTFALDVPIPHHVERWLSREALSLLCKFVRSDYCHCRDEDKALFELEEFGLIAIPRIPTRDVMDGVTLLVDQLKVTDKGYALHRLIRDICEQTIFCCLNDIGAFMGFNLTVRESEEG